MTKMTLQKTRNGETWFIRTSIPDGEVIAYVKRRAECSGMSPNKIAAELISSAARQAIQAENNSSA